jgi:hypothetical protein
MEPNAALEQTVDSAVSLARGCVCHASVWRWISFWSLGSIAHMNKESSWKKNPILNAGALVLTVGVLTFTFSQSPGRGIRR